MAQLARSDSLEQFRWNAGRPYQLGTSCSSSSTTSGSRDDTPTSIQTTTLFTAAERQGNFSQLLTLGTPIQPYNPFSVTSAGNRAPFAGNISPASLFSPAAAKILTSLYYPSTPTNSGLLQQLPIRAEHLHHRRPGRRQDRLQHLRQRPVLFAILPKPVRQPGHQYASSDLQQFLHCPHAHRCDGLDADHQPFAG